MGQWGPTLVSGQGNANLDSSAPLVTDIQADVTTQGPKVKSSGMASPFSLRYVGSYGLGFFPGDAWGSGGPMIMTSNDIRYDHQDFAEFSNVSGGHYAPSVWWILQPGCEVTLTVYW